MFGPEGAYIEPGWRGCFDPKAPCPEKRVRQALGYAIDKNLMRDRLFGGPEVFQVKGWIGVTPTSSGYSPELDPFPFDPDKARRLLADAGYPGGKGVGKVIVNTYASTAIPFLPESAQLAADFWRRELGLDVEVKVGDFTGLRKAENAGALNGQIFWRDNETRREGITILASYYGDPERPSRFYDDPQMFAKVHGALDEPNPDKRAKLGQEVLLELRNEAYQFSVGYVNIPWAVGPRISTWRPYPLAFFPSALHTITLK